MYKIFINEKPFIISSVEITDEAFAKCRRVEHHPAKTLEYIKECEGMKSRGLVVQTDDELYAFKDFFTHFVSIEAAGGIVFNKRQEILLIKRLGKWDLPKGKMDGDETPAEAAVREVEEECAVKELTIDKDWQVSYHTYKMHNHRFLKITYWFLMSTTWDEKLVPQREENITEAKWFNPKEVDLTHLDTYNSIRDLLNGLV